MTVQEAATYFTEMAKQHPDLVVVVVSPWSGDAEGVLTPDVGPILQKNGDDDYTGPEFLPDEDRGGHVV